MSHIKEGLGSEPGGVEVQEVFLETSILLKHSVLKSCCSRVRVQQSPKLDPDV